VLLGTLTFVLDWLPIIIVLFVYDSIHNRLGEFLPRPHTMPQIRVDEALFGVPIPTVRLQRALYSEARPRWWDFLTLAVYMSHFFVTVIIALVLWFRSRPRYLRLMAWFTGMTTLGYVVYALYPAVPPWLASQRGDLAPTHRIVRELWDHLGRHDIAVMFSGTNVYANDIAAIPSLHAAYPLMIAVFFWKSASRAARGTMALYAAIMAIVLVYSAEHYVVDILLGWLLVIVTAWMMQRLWPRATESSRGVRPAAAGRTPPR
jgi:hypothetical protein